MFYEYDNYTYEKLTSDIIELNKIYDTDYRSIGKTVLGKDIWVIKIGRGKKHVFYIGTHHSLEWITSSLLMKFSHKLSDAFKNSHRISNYNIADLLYHTTFHILPMLNSDGTDLVINNDIENEILKEKLCFRNKSCDFSKSWQANINGVDLNHNYDAGFENSKEVVPSASKYQGLHPESEPETQAVCNYVRAHNFDLCMALHSQGEVIYYDYNNIVPPNGYEIGKMLSKSSGYMLDRPEGSAAYGGFKDWFIKKYNKPCYTIEVGKGKNPLPFSAFNNIYDQISEMLILGGFLI